MLFKKKNSRPIIYNLSGSSTARVLGACLTCTPQWSIRPYI